MQEGKGARGSRDLEESRVNEVSCDKDVRRVKSNVTGHSISCCQDQLTADENINSCCQLTVIVEVFGQTEAANYDIRNSLVNLCTYNNYTFLCELFKYEKLLELVER